MGTMPRLPSGPLRTSGRQCSKGRTWRRRAHAAHPAAATGKSWPTRTRWRHDRTTEGRLLGGDDVKRSDVGLLGQQVGCDLTECGRYLAGEMGLAGIFGLERIEDAVLRVTDPEGVPGDGAGLGQRQRPAGFQKGSELGAFAGLGLEQG